MADIWNQIRKLDLYPKTLDEFRVKTYTGGILGLTCIVVMIALFIGEYSNYLYATEIVDHLNVNTSHYAHVKVDFDISFPRIPCKLLSLDSFDESGAPQKHIRQHVYKHRLNEFGMLDSSTQRQEVQGGETVRTEKEMQEMHEKLGLSVGDEEGNSTERNKDPSYIDDDDDDGGACGDCYGAGVEGQCCNTCDEVRQAYEIAGWLFRAAEVKQCEKEIMMDTLKDALAADGGCQIYGWIELSRSSGHFHIAPHKDIHHQGINNGFLSLLDLISFTFEQFNITHTINTLSFGDTYPGIKNPLDEQKRVVQDTHGMYQYYLKIVPTQYHDQTCEESQKKSILPHYFRKKSHHHKLGMIYLSFCILSIHPSIHPSIFFTPMLFRLFLSLKLHSLCFHPFLSMF